MGYSNSRFISLVFIIPKPWYTVGTLKSCVFEPEVDPSLLPQLPRPVQGNSTTIQNEVIKDTGENAGNMNIKSDTQPRARLAANMALLSPSKVRRNTNYSIEDDEYDDPEFAAASK